MRSILCGRFGAFDKFMSSGAKTSGAAATIVNCTVRDLAQVRALGYSTSGPPFEIGERHWAGERY